MDQIRLLHPGHGTYSAINLTVFQPELFLGSSWKVHHALCESDHFPIIVTIEGREEEEKVQRWSIKKANCYHFQSLL